MVLIFLANKANPAIVGGVSIFNIHFFNLFARVFESRLEDADGSDAFYSQVIKYGDGTQDRPGQDLPLVPVSSAPVRTRPSGESRPRRFERWNRFFSFRGIIPKLGVS